MKRTTFQKPLELRSFAQPPSFQDSHQPILTGSLKAEKLDFSSIGSIEQITRRFILARGQNQQVLYSRKDFKKIKEITTWIQLRDTGEGTSLVLENTDISDLLDDGSMVISHGPLPIFLKMNP